MLFRSPTKLPAALVVRVQTAIRAALGDDAGRAVAIAEQLVEWRRLRGASYLDPDAPEMALPPRLAELERGLTAAGAREVIARFERAIVRTAKLHELQHVLDVRASRGLPRELLDALGRDSFELAASEVSAYCATMWRDPDTLWFTVAAALLAAEGPPSPTGRAVAVIVDGVAQRIDPSRNAAVASGVIDKAALADAGAFLAAHDTADVARAAGAAWEAWFTAPLDDIRLSTR